MRVDVGLVRLVNSATAGSLIATVPSPKQHCTSFFRKHLRIWRTLILLKAPRLSRR